MVDLDERCTSAGGSCWLDVVPAGLARHLEVHGPGRDGLVLHGLDGGPLRRQRFGAVWRSLRARAGLPATARFHDYADVRVMPISA